jgi:Xaa-Pro aminopeptidase
VNHLHEIRAWLHDADLTGLVIPSTDEFISEFAPPANRRLLWATGFHGSVGAAVILRERAALFVDGRYFVQGRSDTHGADLDVELTALPSRRAWLRRWLRPGARLGFAPELHSVLDVAQWRGLADELSLELRPLAKHPVDELWSDRPARDERRVDEYAVDYAGESWERKCAALLEHVRRAELQALLVADPEDVSWLLNVRAREIDRAAVDVSAYQIVPACPSRVVLARDGSITWFTDQGQLASNVLAREAGMVTLAAPEALTAALRSTAEGGAVGLDPRRTPASLASIIAERGRVVHDDAVARARWRKHPREIECARRAHAVDAAAVVRFAAWLTASIVDRSISEVEAARKLHAFRSQQADYLGPSMPFMAASGASGAQPHYVPHGDMCRLLNGHPIFWLDSGGHYPGGTTDNTITLALGKPEPKHVLAHTLVLQGYIALARLRMPAGTLALRLDVISRQFLWAEGMDFEHSTGHGVGNYLNIHEGPQIGRDPGPTSLVPIEAGMIVTNEPGYYAPGDFGLRIESHMVVVPAQQAGFLEFETISRLPIDPRLVDFTRLAPVERQWLATYHRLVIADLEPHLDAASLHWLQSFVAPFIG